MGTVSVATDFENSLMACNVTASVEHLEKVPKNEVRSSANFRIVSINNQDYALMIALFKA